MSLFSKNFSAVGIKGVGSLFNILDTTPGNEGTILSIVTGVKKITITPGYMLDVSNISIGELGALTIGALRIEPSGNIYLNDDIYIHTPASNSNLGVGISTLESAILGSARNTAIGHGTMRSNTIGISNTAIGYDTFGANTTGGQNMSMGESALGNNTEGSNNVGIGYFALSQNISGINNVGIGTNALLFNTANENTGIGIIACANNSTGTRNTAVGYSSMVGLPGNSHDDNTAVGHQSLLSISTGTRNTCIGSSAGILTTTGNFNTIIGYTSGSLLQANHNNCILLNNTGSGITQDGEIHFGDTIQTKTFVHSSFITDKQTSSTGSAAIPLTGNYHEITTTGADALTLANGTNGQHLYIILIVDGGDGTLTPATFASGTSILFSDVGNSVHLFYTTTSGWVFMGGTATIL